MGAAAEGAKVAGNVMSKTRKGVREMEMGRKEYRQSYGKDGKPFGLWDAFMDHRDQKTRAKYEKFQPREEAAKMRREMRSAKLRPLKAFAGTKFGKLMMYGAGFMMLMNGGLALPLHAMHSMITGLAAGGVMGWLLHPLENVNESIEHATDSSKKFSASHPAPKNPYSNTQASMAKDEETAINNTKNPTPEPQKNAAVEKDDGYENER